MAATGRRQGGGRGGLADRVRPPRRRPGAAGPRRRAGRGPGAGRAGRGARDAGRATGVPDNPGAWLMATAKNRAIDLARRAQTYERKHEEVAHELGIMMAMDGADLAAAADDEIGDDLLALMFTCCHPSLSTEARVALTLRLLGGLTTAEIARAFLVGEPTVAQRLTRAKRTLREARADFEVPSGAALRARLPDVLEVVYLIFNEGYAASSGERWVRTELCEEALRLGRILAELAPAEPEAHGLIALLEIQASRLGARLGPRRRADPPARPGPLALGPAADRPRAGGAGAGRRAPRAARPLRPAGGDRRLPRAGAGARGHRLGADRGALRGARRPLPLAGRRAEPGGRGRHGLRPGDRPRPARTDRRRARPARLPPAAERPRRPPRPPRPRRRRRRPSSAAPPSSPRTRASAASSSAARSTELTPASAVDLRNA